MKIYLVTPQNPRSFWSYDEILPTLGKKAMFPNLSMPTLAGLTPAEHEVVMVDENVEEIDFDMEADIIGVTGYIIHKDRMFEIIDEFRKRGKFVVVGGPYSSLCPELFEERCDTVFVEEAEETWTQFLDDFEAGSPKSQYKADEKPDLSTAPTPRFDLLKVDQYHALTIQFARGCPFTCEFCDIIVIYGRRPRTKTVDQMMIEIEECHRLGAKQVFIVDDNFIGNKKLAKALLTAMGEWGRERDFPIGFNTEVTIDVANDDELLDLMRGANFTAIFIGIETPNKKALEETKKYQNMRFDLVESVHKVQSYGIAVQAGMIVGFDNDGVGIFQDQLDFIQDARIPVSMTGMLQALPKTPLHARVKKEGRLIGESATGDQVCFSNIIPAGMTRLELYRGYKWLVTELYDYDNYRERSLAVLFNRGSRVHGGKNISKKDLMVLPRVLLDTLVLGGLRRTWFTLRMMGATLLKRPKGIKEAIYFAVVHRALHGYMQTLIVELDKAILEIENEEAAALVVEATGAPENRPMVPEFNVVPALGTVPPPLAVSTEQAQATGRRG